MSALAGMVRFDGGPADATTVARMIDVVEHRGPDFCDLHIEGAIAFAYRWRRTGPSQPIDKQPARDREAQTVIVLDGRLDNRPELTGELGLRDEDLLSDAAIVLAAYRRWGGEVVARLLGDFAFAIWDGRERRLTLARDPRGIRSLCYAVIGGAIAFATEARQLLRVGRVDGGPNMGFLGERLSGLVSHQSDTIFLGVQRLPAAHVLTASPASPIDIRLARHWDIDPGRELRYADDAQYAEHLSELYERAVRARLRGVEKAAVLLSGGVDSSSVVGVASRPEASHPAPAIRAYHHALSAFADADEEPYAVCVARHCGVPVVSVPFQTADVHHYLDTAQRLEDTIPGTPGLSTDILALRMSDDGARVVLTGIGGDEWFGGAYLHSADLLRSGRIVTAARQLWADGHHPDAFHGVAVLAKSCLWAALPPLARRALKALLPERDAAPPGFNPAFVRSVSLIERATPPRVPRRFATLAAETIYAGAMHADGIYLWEESARHASTFGNELAAPLLDRRIAEFAMALPEAQRWSGAETKRVLRAAMTGKLPDPIRLRRRKSDPGAVIYIELGRVRDQGAFTRMGLAEAGVLDESAVASMLRDMERLFAERSEHYKILAYRLWTLFAGECVWQSLFGRDARSTPSRSGVEIGSGTETSTARFG
jgi:asparagine synthase (glutamine-hydrolysing)